MFLICIIVVFWIVFSLGNVKGLQIINSPNCNAFALPGDKTDEDKNHNSFKYSHNVGLSCKIAMLKSISH